MFLHSFGTKPVVDGDVEDSFLFTLGGHWNSVGGIKDINSWEANPCRTSSLKVAYDIFTSFNSRTDICLAITTSSSLDNDELVGECVADSSYRVAEIGASDLTVSYSVIFMQWSCLINTRN